MSSPILITCDSDAGHLKKERRADLVLRFTRRLVGGPVPGGAPPETHGRLSAQA